MRKKKSRDSYIKFKNTADRVMAGGRLKFFPLMMVKSAPSDGGRKGNCCIYNLEVKVRDKHGIDIKFGSIERE